jgi:hypothetical protein
MFARLQAISIKQFKISKNKTTGYTNQGCLCSGSFGIFSTISRINPPPILGCRIQFIRDNQTCLQGTITEG